MLREQSLNLTIATFRIYIYLFLVSYLSNEETRKVKYEQPINDFCSLAFSLTLMESLVSQIVIQFAFTSTHPSLTVNDTNQPNWQVSSWQRRLFFASTNHSLRQQFIDGGNDRNRNSSSRKKSVRSLCLTRACVFLFICFRFSH